MCLNVGKTKTMIISRSRTMLPSFTELTLNGIALEESSELIILGVTCCCRSPGSRYAMKPASRKYDATFTGSLQSCKIECMLCCCLGAAKLVHSVRRCVTV